MADNGSPRSRSIHHVAYTTRDAEATYDFYANKLGMTLLRTENHRNGDGWFRHFFFDIGGGETIAFFLLEDVGEDSDYKTDVSTGLGLPPWANHVAFRLETLDELDAMAARMHEHDVEYVMRIDHGWCTSIYTLDPNDIMIEFCVTTDSDEFSAQTPEEALRLMRLPVSEFAEETRKDESIGELV